MLRAVGGHAELRLQQLPVFGQAPERLELAGELPVTKLTSRTTKNTGRLANEFDFDQATTEALRRLAQTQNTTLYVVLLATLFNLLNRYTRQSDLVVGSIASGRIKAEFARTAGFFANAVVIRE